MFILFHGRFPGEKAASLFAAKDAEAFAAQGIQVQVVIPRRRNVDPNTAFDYYNVHRNFDIVVLPIIDFFSWKIPSKLSFYLNFLAFSLACRSYLKKESTKDDIIYSNESLPLYFASALNRKTFYEMHDFPESKFWLFKMFLKSCTWILIHNRWKVEKFRQTFPGIKAHIVCEPNAVQIEEFDIPLSKEEARKQLNLPNDKKIAVYTGHLFGWKGVETLAQAARFLDNDFLVVFVGGTDNDVAQFKQKHGTVTNVSIVGHKPHKEIPVWQKASDVLVLPNTAKEAISAYYTSPMKLFEYMASGRPIVASDIPSIREIVDENSAVLVKADEPKLLAEGIVKAAGDQILVNNLVTEAFEKVRIHTWAMRAQRIIAFMNKSN